MSEQSFEIRYKQTAIKVISDKKNRQKILDELARQYTLLEGYIQKNPSFLTSYEPVKAEKDTPHIAKIMCDASEITGVGPMASVAGAFSDVLGEYILSLGAKEAIVENGGDIFLKTRTEKIIGVHAGPSKFSDKLGLRIRPEETPIGICTSSDSVGHSISLGKSDAVTVIADTAVLADAAASAIGNAATGNDAIEKAVEKANTINGIRGALIIKGEKMGVCGKIPELIKIQETK